MARIDNLGNFLADIATAIKNKKGSTKSIAAKDFDTEIENVVELAKEDYNILTADKIHLSTKYSNWQEEVKKEENNIAVVPAEIGTTKQYAPLDVSYKFTNIKVNYEVKIPKATVNNSCLFKNGEDVSVEVKTTASGGFSVIVSNETGKDTYPTVDYAYHYNWDDASQSYKAYNRRNLYWMPAGGVANSDSAITGPDSELLSQTLVREVSCSTPDAWKPEYAEAAKVFVYPIIPEEVYIYKDNAWVNTEDTIPADKYANGNEVNY